MDLFGIQNGNTVSYTNNTLVEFNITYNSGGGGVHIFASENVTAANNTCYNNNIDPNGVGSGGAASTPIRAIVTRLSITLPSPFRLPLSEHVLFILFRMLNPIRQTRRSTQRCSGEYV